MRGEHIKTICNTSFKIDLSIGYKTLMITSFCLSIAGVIFSIIVPIPIFTRVTIFLFFLFLSYHFIAMLYAHVKIYSDFLCINAGLFIHKKIFLKDVNSIYTVDYDKVAISKDNPVLSKNVVAVEYKENKIYISIKNKGEFVKLLNKLIMKV